MNLKAQGAAEVPRPVLETVSNRPAYDLAQEVVAALFHRFVGVHEVLAIGGGVARVRDELHGLAEIGLVVIKGGWGDAFTVSPDQRSPRSGVYQGCRPKVPRSTLSDAKDPI